MDATCRLTGGLITLLISGTVFHYSHRAFERPMRIAEPSHAEFIIVSEDTAKFKDGCDAVSIIDAKSPTIHRRGSTMASPSMLAVSPTTGDVFSARSHGMWLSRESADKGEMSDAHIYVMRAERLDGDIDWSSTYLRATKEVVINGDVAFSVDGEHVFVTTIDSATVSCGAQGYIEKFEYDDIDWEANHLGPALASYETLLNPQAIHATSTGLLYIISIGEIGGEGSIAIEIVSAEDLSLVAEPMVSRQNWPGPCGSGEFYSTMSADGDLLIYNSPWRVERWEEPGITIADMRSGEIVRHYLDDVEKVGGMSVTLLDGRRILAVNVTTAVVLYEIKAADTVVELARYETGVESGWQLRAPITWADNGAVLIVGNDESKEPDITVYSVDDLVLTKERDIDLCSEGTLPMAIVVASIPLNLEQTPTPSPTLTVTPRPTQTSTSIPTATATRLPLPLYLPVALRETRCPPELRRVDVILALDTSSSMAGATGTGRTKLTAALEAARAFLDVLVLGEVDRAAIVTFDREARVVQGLSGDRAALDTALDSIVPGEQTCLPCAVDVAAAELAGPSARDGVSRTIVLLTDGHSNPRPASEAVASAANAKAAGVVMFTIGIGEELDVEALRTMASKPSYFQTAADGETLRSIYEAIAVEIPCSVEVYWGRR